MKETVHAIVPGLWLYEVGNTIARRFTRQAVDWLSALTKFGLEEAAPSGAWLVKTLGRDHWRVATATGPTDARSPKEPQVVRQYEVVESDAR